MGEGVIDVNRRIQFNDRHKSLKTAQMAWVQLG